MTTVHWNNSRKYSNLNRKIFQDVSAEEFQICLSILSATKLGSTPKGQAELVQLCVDQADLSSEEEVILIEDDVVERYIQCATHALPYFSVGFPSHVSLNRLSNHVSSRSKIAANSNHAVHQIRMREAVSLANMEIDWSHRRHEGSIAFACVESIRRDVIVLRCIGQCQWEYWSHLPCSTGNCRDTLTKRMERKLKYQFPFQDYMPLPPDAEDVLEECPSFKFSHAECLLYALHKLGKQSAEFFQFKDDAAKLKDFRSRLQYLARGTQG